MAYVQAQSPNRRAITLTGVAALHVAAAYALLNGFAVDILERVDPRLVGRHIPADPPPPEPQPQPNPVKDPLEQKFVAPKPLIDVNRSPSEATVIDLLPIEPRPLPTAPAGDPLPLPSATASYAPKAAVPLGSPGRWATSADYPAAELRREIEGTARFRVTIGTDGRVRNCEIVSSSGSPGLDRATCENVAKRARFKPATDETGATVSGTYSNAIRWEIPD